MTTPTTSQPITVTLGKAHQLLQGLKAAAKAAPKGDDDPWMRRVRRSQGADRVKASAVFTAKLPRVQVRGASSDVEALAGRITGRIEAARSRLAAHLALQADIEHVKEAIFAANQRHGVSARLSAMALAKHEVAVLEQLVQELEDAGASTLRAHDITGPALARLGDQMTAEQQEIEIAVVLHDPADLRARITTARQRIHHDDEAVRELNATIRIPLQISPEGRARLGLV